MTGAGIGRRYWGPIRAGNSPCSRSRRRNCRRSPWPPAIACRRGRGSLPSRICSEWRWGTSVSAPSMASCRRSYRSRPVGAVTKCRTAVTSTFSTAQPTIPVHPVVRWWIGVAAWSGCLARNCGPLEVASGSTTPYRPNRLLRATPQSRLGLPHRPPPLLPANRCGLASILRRWGWCSCPTCSTARPPSSRPSPPNRQRHGQACGPTTS